MHEKSIVARIRRSFDHLEKNGFPNKGDSNVRARAIFAAHGALPSTHWDAQHNAQDFLDAENIQMQLKGTSPCIVLGFKGPYKYFVVKGYIDRSYGDFRPACIEHLTEYDECNNACTYGVKLKGEWVHELLSD